jgi:hypothetical protein
MVILLTLTIDRRCGARCCVHFVYVEARSPLTIILINSLVMGTGKGKMLGAHMWDIRVLDLTKPTLQVRKVKNKAPHETVPLTRAQKVLAAVCLYAAAALFVKLSLFCLYLRLFKVKTAVRWLIYGGMAACVILYSASVIANLVWFIPPPGQPQTIESWSAHSAGAGKRPYMLAVVQGTFGTISDIYLLVIPVQSILALNMPLAKRIGVSMIFMTGIV